MNLFLFGFAACFIVGLAYWIIYMCVQAWHADALAEQKQIQHNEGYARGCKQTKEEWIEDAIDRGFGRYCPVTGRFEWFDKADLQKPAETSKTDA